MWLGLTASACTSSPTAPTPPSPPPVPDPPKIACPESVTVASATGQPVLVLYAIPSVMSGAPPVTGTCTPPSGSLFNIGANTVTCTATDARGRTDSCDFVVTVTPPPMLAVTRFVAFGDSITWGEDGLNPTTSSLRPFSRIRPEVRVPQPYPAVLQQQLISRYTLQAPMVDNQGSPGEEVTDPQTLPRFRRAMASGKYDAVLIMEGANDLLAARDSRIEPRIIDGLRQMVREAQTRGIRPFLATIPPERDGCCPDRGISWREVPDLNGLIRGLAMNEGVPLVDTYQKLIDSVDADIGPDGLHPTPQGYTQIAGAFFGVIEQTLEQAHSSGASGIGRLRGGALKPASPVRPVPRTGRSGASSRSCSPEPRSSLKPEIPHARQM